MMVTYTMAHSGLSNLGRGVSAVSDLTMADGGFWSSDRGNGGSITTCLGGPTADASRRSVDRSSTYTATKAILLR